MIDFEKRKEKNILNSQMRQEETLLNTEQSKFLYEITFSNTNQIKDLQKEIHILKTQMCDILNIFNDKTILNKLKNKSNKYLFKKEEKHEEKDELLKSINKEITNQLNENIELLNNKLVLFTNEYKSELENEINQIKNELMSHDKLLISLKNDKLDKVYFNENILDFKNNFDKLNRKIIQNQTFIKSNGDDIINNKNKSVILDSKDLKKFKKEIYSDFEKINLKILNELKNQAYDIKSLYQELQNNSKINIKNSINTEDDVFNENFNYSKIIRIINSMEEELSKKVNLEHLNYALNAQSKLNEALNSTSQICRMCWDSEGILTENKYIKWSSQNINTALNIFKWTSNLDTIKILKKGVYKIVIGLIGLEYDKSIKVCFNDINNNYEIDYGKNNIIGNKYKYNIDDWNNGNDKGNIKFIEKYFACVENTEIKICLVDNENCNNDISEEAFLELKKII